MTDHELLASALEDATRRKALIASLRTPTSTETSDLIGLLGDLIEDHGITSIRKAFAQIILPWQDDGCRPRGWVRRTAAGVDVLTIDRRLGGFAEPHHPEKLGVGIRGTSILRSNHLARVIRPGVCSRWNGKTDATKGKTHATLERRDLFDRAADELESWLELDSPGQYRILPGLRPWQADYEAALR
mgnify:CR=1 FL=1|tara:strand:- start:567 stop:1127 length:561 start_codon:yes stop_codon:yes gene_type:complete